MPDLPHSTDNDDIAGEAIQMVTELVLHEISPQVRRVKIHAQAELAERFHGSTTEASLERLHEFLKVLRRVHEAAGAPNVKEFDLTDLIQTISGRDEFSTHPVLVTRSDTLTVLGDPDLIDLAVSNGLVNAVEASDASGKPVIVNFGRTDKDAWITILDEGIGLPPGADFVWKPGRTNKGKSGHFGWGLTVAQRSMRSLHGVIFLTPRDPVGVSFEVRWPIGEDR
ncbi:sensor histidine kinase [Segeticoccus rhizosphaerae]|jgi:signal transduction histidine kinase|uniref:sensor histidine kinase n=1 Tax=Segeticoccus rhizosphaerae TaxID=1104777 RepID=UPI001396C72A|nr:HAMP domain-containing sensor histidine kinase [Segeticoccus rhizosphaerae]